MTRRGLTTLQRIAILAVCQGLILLEPNVEKLLWVARFGHPIDWALFVDLNTALSPLASLDWRAASFVTTLFGALFVFAGFAALRSRNGLTFLRVLYLASGAVFLATSVVALGLVIWEHTPYSPFFYRPVAGFAWTTACWLAASLVRFHLELARSAA